MRDVPLDGAWDVWLDPDGRGVAQGWVQALSAGETPPGGPDVPLALAVPGPLEADPSTRDYDGAAWYVRRFVAPDDVGFARASLRFARADYACRAWLDGEPLGEHEGDLDPFAFDVTGRLTPGREHVLVALVVDPGDAEVYGLRLKATPHAKQSWYENFGGLLGPVALRVETSWGARDVRLAVDAERSTVRVTGQVLGPPGWSGDARVQVELRELGEAGGSWHGPRVDRVDEVALVDGVAPRFDVTLALSDAARWSPERPVLHVLSLTVESQEVFRQRLGFRTLAVEGGDLLLDGRPLRVSGVLWQPHVPGTGGLLPDDATLAATARAMKATGFDLVRAHVRPAPQAFLDACDEIGLLVLEEPGIGWVDDDPALPARMERELDRMVAAHGHHPSIVAWGVLNELSGRAYRHADALSAHLAALDPTRPVLEDSGAFFGQGRMHPPGGGAPLAMVDRHAYPPYPLPPQERETLRTLSEAGGGPVFVSEFGYGTLLDAEAAAAPLRARGHVTAERVMYESWAASQRRARAAGEAGPAGDWVAAAAALQADAAEDMVEALRANAAVDLFCYTQWQAVSQESSAGLLDPTGADRPARARMARALRPLLAALVPLRPSVLPGEASVCLAVVDNRTGAAVDGTLHVTCGEAELPPVSGPWPPGVTGRELTLPPADAPGPRTVRARLLGPDGAELDLATPRTVLAATSPAPLALRTRGGLEPHVWAPTDEPETLDLLRRWGVRPEPSPAPTVAGGDGRPLLAIIGRPDGLRARMAPDDWLALWAGVHAGGAALVLAPDPARDAVGARFGTARGTRTLASLPVPVTVGGAPGHFMARVHVTVEDGTPRLLGRGDEVLSPVAMLLGPPRADVREHVVTLGWLGNRIGAPDAVLPVGRGALHVIGLPLLAPLDARVEPRRDARLASRLARVAASLEAPPASSPTPSTPTPATPTPATPTDATLTDATPTDDAPTDDAPTDGVPTDGVSTDGWAEVSPDLRAAFLLAWDRIDRLLALDDRVSPFAGGADTESRRPPALQAALLARCAALEELLEGRADAARQRIEAAAGSVWRDRAESFLEAEARVLDRLDARVAAAGREDWDSAYDALSDWIAAVLSFQAGRDDEADAALARAAARLGDA